MFAGAFTMSMAFLESFCGISDSTQMRPSLNSAMIVQNNIAW